MKHLLMVLVLMGIFVEPMMAQAAKPAGEDAKPAAEVPSRFAGTDEATLKSEMQRLMAEITELARRSRAIRDRAMTQDEDLKAMNQQIAHLQEQIRATLAEKYPTLADLEKRKTEAIAEHGAAAAALRELKQAARDEAEQSGEQ